MEAVGFVARPIGGILFGHFGDRIGRKAALILTILIMGGSSFLIGLIPNYESIGIAAPIALTHPSADVAQFECKFNPSRPLSALRN
jgi:MFS family permease